MRPSAPDAGKRGRRLRGVLAGLLAGAAMLAGAAGPAVEGAPDPLTPQGFIPGGFSVPTATRAGRAPSGAYVKLIYPAALAASGPDLYVADSGAGQLLRIDTIGQSVARLASLPPLPSVRLKAGRDGTVYVLRPGRPSVERLSREGQRIGTFAADFDILQPSDLVIEPTLNRIWIADAAGGVFAFHPSGRMSEPLAGRGDGFASEGSGAVLLAAGPQRVVGVDARCRCIITFDRDGRTLGHFGEGALINPQGLALDEHNRVWVIDAGDHRLKVFDADVLVANIPAARLGLADLTAIAIDLHRAYLADGPGGKIGIFAILPPPRRAP